MAKVETSAQTPGSDVPAPPDASPSRRPSERDLTTGNILHHIIALAIPSAASNLLSYSYHFVDMLWLGRIGPSALAVIATYQYFFMVLVIFNQIIGIGSITLIARSFGAREYTDCRRYIGQTFSFKLVIAFVVMGIGLTCQRWAWVAFGSSAEVVDYGLAYTTVMFSVIPIYFSAFTLRTALSSIGDMKAILWITLTSTILNIALDPFFIFETVYIGPFTAIGVTEPLVTLPGLGMGVAGAAWASFAAILVLFLFGLWYFTSGRTYVRVNIRQFFSWHWGTIWRILRVGTPPAVGENLNSIVQIAVGRVLNTYGTAVFAASSVVNLTFGLIWVPIGGIVHAVVTIVGQNLGAGKPERARKSVTIASWLTIGLLVVVLAAAAIWTEQLVRMFVPGADAESLETLKWGVCFMRIALLMLLLTGVGMVVGSAFWGAGDTKPTMYAQVIASYGVQLPIVLIGALVLKLEDPTYILWAWAAASLVNAVLIWIFFRQGKWLKAKV